MRLLIILIMLVSLPVLANCGEYSKHLESCSPYKCKYKHPMGAMMGNPNMMMEKKIVGIKNKKCITTEQMPNNGKMDCELSEESRKQFAKELSISEKSMASGKTKISFSSKSNNSYIVNGKKVKSVGNELMNNGECKISGY